MPKKEKTFNKAEYDKQFMRDNYYRLTVVLPKEMRAVIDEAASKAGVSKNGFVIDAIQEKIDNIK